MERNYRKKHCFAFLSSVFLFPSAYAHNSHLEGKIIVPANVDPSSVVIQVAGLPQNVQIATSPNHDGYFKFNDIFPAGSSASLMIWDRDGVLTRRLFSAYVSEKGGFYTIYLEKYSFMRDLSQSFGVEQNLMSAGVCGQVTGLSASEIQGSQVTLKETNTRSEYRASYFNNENLPSIEQNYLSQYGYFCFFNVQSQNNSYEYNLTAILKDGTTRTFSLYLPPYTFANNISFDVKSALYRPVKLFAWQAELNQEAKWVSVENTMLSTSSDYSQVPIRSSSNELVYFPVGDEFLTLNYGSSKEETENHFFILEPRSALFNRNILATIQNYVPGQTYVDTFDPVVLKILTGDDSQKLTSIAYNQRYHGNKGSLFLNLDISQFQISKKDLVIQLNNFLGESVSQFVEQADHPGSLVGFFDNIPVGLNQLVVMDHQNHILWSSVVRSIPNKTQVLSNAPAAKLLTAKSFKENAKNQVVAYTKNPAPQEEQIVQKKNSILEVFPSDPSLDQHENEPHSLHEEQMYVRNNLFFQVSEEKLCMRDQPTEDNFTAANTFMGFVPLVAVLQDRNRFFI